MSQTDASSPNPLLRVVTDYPMAQVVYVAAELGLADLLAAGPRTIEDFGGDHRHPCAVA